MATQTNQIGRYRMVGTLGQGAMGRVYLAEDPFLGTRVAVKLIKRDSMRENEVILMRFRREAALGARIRHPNIVGIYDVGLDPDHGPYMVMEYVNGYEFLQHMARTETSISERLEWIRQIAGALDSAHRAGVIHRDVKPGNILISSEGQAKLIDWGVARVDDSSAEKDAPGNLDKSSGGELATPVPGSSSDQFEPVSAEPAEGSVSVTITQMGTLIGTPAYTAPELLTNKASYSPATDLWALTITAYQVLMGHMPFVGASISSTLEAIAYGPLEWLLEVSPDVQEVFSKALAKDPGDRYPDFQSFISALYKGYGLPDQPIPGPFAQSASVQTEAARSKQGLPAVRRSLRRGALAVGATLALALVAWFAMRSPVEWRDLTIHTQPEGATVYLNDVLLGKTPLDNFRVEDRGGHLKIAKKHYLTWERRLQTSEEFVSVALQLAPYRVDVETEPSGADLFLDGQPLGPSPLSGLRIATPGSHVLEIRLPGYRTEKIPLDPARPLPRPIQLKPQ
ncbi:MAG: serine/threonine protein kinase [Holophagaceae bacterium]|nr:serine/threonine protein kinase [Holophagaceae bacterium]